MSVYELKQHMPDLTGAASIMLCGNTRRSLLAHISCHQVRACFHHTQWVVYVNNALGLMSVEPRCHALTIYYHFGKQRYIIYRIIFIPQFNRTQSNNTLSLVL